MSPSRKGWWEWMTSGLKRSSAAFTRPGTGTGTEKSLPLKRTMAGMRTTSPSRLRRALELRRHHQHPVPQPAEGPGEALDAPRHAAHVGQVGVGHLDDVHGTLTGSPAGASGARSGPGPGSNLAAQRPVTEPSPVTAGRASSGRDPGSRTSTGGGSPRHCPVQATSDPVAPGRQPDDHRPPGGRRRAEGELARVQPLGQHAGGEDSRSALLPHEGVAHRERPTRRPPRRGGRRPCSRPGCAGGSPPATGRWARPGATAAHQARAPGRAAPDRRRAAAPGRGGGSGRG